MIVKKFVYKSGVKFKRVKYNPNSYLCVQYMCEFREGNIRGNHPICDLCHLVRTKFTSKFTRTYIKSLLYIPC